MLAMLRHALAFISSLLIFFAIEARGAWAQRYESLKSISTSGIASLPDGGYVLRSNGAEGGVITIIDGRGKVRIARKISDGDVNYVTASSSGQIYATIGKDRSDTNRLVKFNGDLSIAWAHDLTDIDGGVALFTVVAATRDGGVVLVGRGYKYSIVSKVSSRGEVEWATRLDISGGDWINTIRQSRDDGFIAAGGSPKWAWLVKLDGNGRLLWQRTFGPRTGWLRSLVEMKDGSILAAGKFDGKPILIKTTAQGDVLWSKLRTGEPGDGMSLVEVADGIVGAMTAGEVQNAVHLFGLRADGGVRWARRFQPSTRSVLNADARDLTLAVTKEQVAFVPTFEDLAVFSVDAATGPIACDWFTNSDLTLTDVALRDEGMAIEVTRLRFATSRADLRVLSIEVQASAQTCPPATVRFPQPTLPPSRPTMAFRAVEDTSSLTRKLAEMLMAGKFEELEAEEKVARARTSRDPVRPSQPLRAFYDAFADNDIAPAAKRLERLREWVSARPTSIAARLALANTLYATAWTVRGSGRSVTDSGWSGYKALMAETQKVLDGVSKEAEANPLYWYVRIPLTHELGLGDVSEVGLHALSLHPDPELASATARFLYPQWGGSREQYMKFADDAARVTKATYGDAVYMWLVYRIENHQTSNDYKLFKTDWSRVVKGADDLINLKPDWPPSYHRLAILAERYKDIATLKRMFERPELDWYEDAILMW
ncbi:MAG TPA: DUF4034 domain-containing protein, partial [Thermoanaerobaculia bacterium]